MQAFPGSFGPDVFDGLALERYAEAFDLAVALIEARRQAEGRE